MVTAEDGHTILDFSAPVEGPVASPRSEAAGIFSILQIRSTESGGALQRTCSAHNLY